MGTGPGSHRVDAIRGSVEILLIPIGRATIRARRVAGNAGAFDDCSAAEQLDRSRFPRKPMNRRLQIIGLYIYLTSFVIGKRRECFRMIYSRDWERGGSICRNE